MDQPTDTQHLDIKKYSNRRFYDATRSRHVTLGEMHELICTGHDLTITDSKTGQDITNVVLTQIILDRDPPKLDIFPPDILHQMIRTQQQYLGSVVEQFFSQVLDAHKGSQQQWMQFVRNTFGAATANPLNPMDWTKSLFAAMTPPAMRTTDTSANTDAPAKPNKREVEELQDQVARLTRLVEQLADQHNES